MEPRQNNTSSNNSGNNEQSISGNLIDADIQGELDPIIKEANVFIGKGNQAYNQAFSKLHSLIFNNSADKELEQAEEYYANALKTVARGGWLQSVPENYAKQSNSVLGLAKVYSLRADITTDPYKKRDQLLKAVAFCQYALRIDDLLNMRGTIPINIRVQLMTRDAIMAQIEQIERKFIESLNNAISPELYANNAVLTALRNNLDLLRATINSLLSDLPEDRLEHVQAIKNIYQKTDEGMREIVQQISKECRSVLGEPPVKYAMVGLGSYARMEMTPYSDLEFAILLDKENEDIKDYFRQFSQLLHLYVIRLGETILPALNIPSLNYRFKTGSIFYDRIMPRGFSFDGAMPGAAHTPLGLHDKEGNTVYELIHTPAYMAKEFLPLGEEIKEGYHLASILSAVRLIEGNQDLVTQYESKIKEITTKAADRKIILPEALATLKNCPIHKVRALTLLTKDLARFNLQFSEQNEGKIFDVKKEIYRLPSTLLDALTMYYQLPATDAFTKIELLYEKEIINKVAVWNLQEALSIAMELRLRTYGAANAQQETMDIPSLLSEEGLSREKTQAVFYVSEHMLRRFYQIITPWHRAMRQFYQHKLSILSSQLKEEESLLKDKSFYDNSDKVEGLLLLRLLRYRTALNHLKNFFQQNPSDWELPSIIGWCERRLGCYDPSASYAMYTSTYSGLLAQTNDTSATPFMIDIFYNLALMATQLKKFAEAEQYYTKGLEQCMALYGENHLTTAAVCYGKASLLHELGRFKETEELFRRALNIYLFFYGNKHPSVAHIYNNLGAVASGLNETWMAIEYQQHALDCYQAIYHGPHPDIAMVYGNLGCNYISLYRQFSSTSKEGYDLELVYNQEPRDEEIEENKLYLYLTENQVQYKAKNPAGMIEKVIITDNELTSFLETIKQALQDRSRELDRESSKVLFIVTSKISYSKKGYRLKLRYDQEPRDEEIRENELHLYLAENRVQYKAKNSAGMIEKVIITDNELTSFLETIKQALQDRSRELDRNTEEVLFAVTFKKGYPPKSANVLAVHAEDYLALAIKTYTQLFGNTERLLGPLSNLINFYLTTKKFMRAISVGEQALEMIDSNNMELHADTAALLANLGEAYVELPNYEKALAYKHRALKIFITLYGKEHHLVGKIYLSLASISKKKGETREAERYYREALGVFRKALGDYHDDTQMAQLVCDLSLWLPGNRQLSEEEKLNAEKILTKAHQHATHQKLIGGGEGSRIKAKAVSSDYTRWVIVFPNQAPKEMHFPELAGVGIFDVESRLRRWIEEQYDNQAERPGIDVDMDSFIREDIATSAAVPDKSTVSISTNPYASFSNRATSTLNKQPVIEEAEVLDIAENKKCKCIII